MFIPGLLISLSLNAQQPFEVAASTKNTEESTTKQEIATLKSQLAEQQRQLEQLRAAMQRQQDAIEKATRQVENADARRVNAPASYGEVASTTPILPMPAIVAPANPGAVITGAQTQQQPGKGESPLGFKIGAATFTPLGFIDFISVTRSTATGNNLGTGFNSIPYANAANGGLSEERFSLQNSRIGLRIDSVYKDIKVMGYLETDFLGNAANGLYTTSNANTLRMRLFFADLKKDAFGLTFGQTWSLLTPNRSHIGVLPGEIFYTQDVDTNYVAGLTWARQPGIRFTWAPTKKVTWAVALENPEQYIGSAGVVTLPKTLGANTGFVGEFQNGAGNGTPNLVPDLISKLAFDGGSDNHHAHLEIAGVVSTYKSFNPLTTGPGADKRFVRSGVGGSINANLEIFKGTRLVTNNYYSDGGGRYLQGLVPDFILRGDGSIGLIHTGSTVSGLEVQATPKTMFYGYYSGIFANRSTAVDTDGKTSIGYGVVGGSLNANRTIQEATFGLVNNFWKSPQYGALTLNLQYSYLNRNPWSVVTSGSPTNAQTHIGYIDLRYTLP